MSSRKTGKSEIPELFLEKHALYELAQAQTRDLDAFRLESARVQLAADSAAIVERLPAERVVPIILSRYAMEKNRMEALVRERGRKRLAIWAGLATSAVAVPLVALLWLHSGAGTESAGAALYRTHGGERIKGDERPFLAVYRSASGQVEKLAEGGPVRSGDLIQLAYVASGRKHGVVVSIDGAGSVTLHWPERADGSTLLEPKGEIPLVHAYEIDEAPLYERFLFVTAERPINVERVLETARALAQDVRLAASGSLTLPEGWEQCSFILKKVAP